MEKTSGSLTLSAAVVFSAFVFPDELHPATDHIVTAAREAISAFFIVVPPKKSDVVNVPLRTFVEIISQFCCDYTEKV